MAILWLCLFTVWYYYFSYIVLHELSHYIVAKLAGLKVVGFRVWPHKADNYGSLGSVKYKGPVSDITEMFLCTSPLIKAFVLAAIYIYLVPTLTYLAVPLIFTEFIEVVSWLACINMEGSDAGQLKELLGKKFGNKSKG